MAQNNQKPHAIIFPFPLQGHVIPTVHLSLKLASNGFSVTFVNTQWVDDQLRKAHPQSPAHEDIFAEARRSGLDIRYATVSDGLPAELDRSANMARFGDCLLNEFHTNVDELVGELVRSSKPAVNCLIGDTFLAGLGKIARKYDLVSISFWTEPALVFTQYYHLDLLVRNGHCGSDDNRKDIIDYIPGIEAMEPTDMASYLQDTTTISAESHQIIHKAFEDGKEVVDFIICNTVQELESKVISTLHQKQPIFAIGPLFPSGFTKSVVPTSLWAVHWLGTKPRGSVLYVSFGSLAQVALNDLVEIAHGLSLSGGKFCLGASAGHRPTRWI